MYSEVTPYNSLLFDTWGLHLEILRTFTGKYFCKISQMLALIGYILNQKQHASLANANDLRLNVLQIFENANKR